MLLLLSLGQSERQQLRGDRVVLLLGLLRVWLVQRRLIALIGLLGWRLSQGLDLGHLLHQL